MHVRRHGYNIHSSFFFAPVWSSSTSGDDIGFYTWQALHRVHELGSPLLRVPFVFWLTAHSVFIRACLRKVRKSLSVGPSLQTTTPSALPEAMWSIITALSLEWNGAMNVSANHWHTQICHIMFTLQFFSDLIFMSGSRGDDNEVKRQELWESFNISMVSRNVHCLYLFLQTALIKYKKILSHSAILSILLALCDFSERVGSRHYIYILLQDTSGDTREMTVLQCNEFGLQLAATLCLSNCHRRGICVYDSSVALRNCGEGATNSNSNVYSLLCDHCNRRWNKWHHDVFPKFKFYQIICYWFTDSCDWYGANFEYLHLSL